MIYKYPVSKFDLTQFLKHFTTQFSYEGECVGDEIQCTSLEELRAYDDGVICWIDVSSCGFLLDEYKEFSESEDYEEEYFIERLGKVKWKRILRIAKARHWQPDLWLSCAISNSSVAVLVSLTDNRITIETGCVGGESERSSASFEEGHLQGMPEIEMMIKDVVTSCLLKSAARQPSRKSRSTVRARARR